jgi:hypothetical protein
MYTCTDATLEETTAAVVMTSLLRHPSVCLLVCPGLETRYFPLTAVKEVCDEAAISRCEESLPSFTGERAPVFCRRQ